MTPVVTISTGESLPCSVWVFCGTDWLSDARMHLQDLEGWTHIVRPDIFLWRGQLKVLRTMTAHLKFFQDPAGWTHLSSRVIRRKKRFVIQHNLMIFGFVYFNVRQTQVDELVVDTTIDLTDSPPAPAVYQSYAAESPASVLAILRCPVCLDSLAAARAKGYRVLATTCGHIFCSNCLPRCVAANSQCPTCRARLPGPSNYHNLYIE